ncbi:MAG: hypothetical protein KDB14_02585 [Planctomycetales bacterium]|nr:hypothetical protein [Planctomycetales bacterium]
MAVLEDNFGLVVSEIKTGNRIAQTQFQGTATAVGFSAHDTFVAIAGLNDDKGSFPVRWRVTPWKQTSQGLAGPKCQVSLHQHAQTWDKFFTTDDAGVLAWDWEGKLQSQWPSELIGVSPSGERYAQMKLGEVLVRDTSSRRVLASKELASDSEMIEGAIFESETCLIVGVAPFRSLAPSRLVSWTFEKQAE